MNNNIIAATDENFQKEVIESSVPVLVDFWAPWCGPCRMVGPVVEELANEYTGKIKVAKLNTDENQEIAYKYGIRSIPTLLLFRGGNIVDTVIGAVPKRVLQSKIEDHLKSNGVLN